MHLWAKNLNPFLFTHAPEVKMSPRFLSSRPIQREITSFTQAEVFENLQLEGAGNCERTEKVAKI